MKNLSITSTLLAASLLSVASTSSADDTTELYLVNASLNTPVGQEILYYTGRDISNTGTRINFELDTLDTDLQSVRFIVTDNVTNQVVSDRIESAAPFSAFGDTNGDYNAYTVSSGSRLQIEMQGFKEKFAVGEQAYNRTVIVEFSGEPRVYGGFFIVNADSDTRVAAVSNGAQYSLSDTGTNLNFVRDYGNVSSDLGERVASVTYDFFYDSRVDAANSFMQSYVENVAPYAVLGDANGDFNGMSFEPGNVRVDYKAYSGPNGTGDLVDRFFYTLNLTE